MRKFSPARTWAQAAKKMRGFTLLELVMVVAILLIVAAIGIPTWTKMTRTYRLRSDVNRITGMINANRMRGAATFSRVVVDCSQADATNCRGSSAACTVSLENFQSSTSTVTQQFLQDSPQMRVCLSTGISLAVPTSTYGVQTQSATSPSQSATLYFNSLGFPITSSGGPKPNYAMYLKDTTNGNFMAIGIAPNGKPNVFTLSGNTWLMNQ